MKRFRMFAGPNGSGKSTLIEDVKKSYQVGYFVNADVIEYSLKTRGFLDCEVYLPIKVTQEDWKFFLLQAENKSADMQMLQAIHIRDNILVASKNINSYVASVIANFFRDILLKEDTTFSFETVMSHISKVEFLQKAKDKGFKTYLYFIGTQDPQINIERIFHRVTKGGHTVSEEKVISRYYRSMELLHAAFSIADRAFIFDTTFSDKCSLLIEKRDNFSIEILQEDIPEWVQTYLLQKIL